MNLCFKLAISMLTFVSTGCSFKSPLHSKMSGIYEFTYPAPYLLATFGRKDASHMPDFPFSVIEHELGKDFAPFEKPEFTEINEKILVKVDYYLFEYAVDSELEQYLVTEIATGRGIRINAHLSEYLVKVKK